MFLCMSGCWEWLSSIQQSGGTDASAWVHTSPAETCETETHAQAVCQSLLGVLHTPCVLRVPSPAALSWSWGRAGRGSQGCPEAGEALGAALLQGPAHDCASVGSLRAASSFFLHLSGTAGCTSTCLPGAEGSASPNFSSHPVMPCSIFSTNKSPADIPFVTACSPAPSSIDSSLFQM